MRCLFINLQCEKQPCYSFWLINTRLLVIVFAEARLLLKAWKAWIRTEGIGGLNNCSFHPQAVALQEGFASHSTLRDSLSRLQTLLILIFLSPFRIPFSSAFSIFTFQSLCFGIDVSLDGPWTSA